MPWTLAKPLAGAPAGSVTTPMTSVRPASSAFWHVRKKNPTASLLGA
jgi:hypothetical protein